MHVHKLPVFKMNINLYKENLIKDILLVFWIYIKEQGKHSDFKLQHKTKDWRQQSNLILKSEHKSEHQTKNLKNLNTKPKLWTTLISLNILYP